MKPEVLPLLVCPESRRPLQFYTTRTDGSVSGILLEAESKRWYPVVDGVPDFREPGARERSFEQAALEAAPLGLRGDLVQSSNGHARPGGRAFEWREYPKLLAELATASDSAWERTVLIVGSMEAEAAEDLAKLGLLPFAAAAGKLPFPDGSLRVVLSDVKSLGNDWGSGLKEAARVLRYGGMLVLADNGKPEMDDRALKQFAQRNGLSEPQTADFRVTPAPKDLKMGRPLSGHVGTASTKFHVMLRTESTLMTPVAETSELAAVEVKPRAVPAIRFDGGYFVKYPGMDAEQAETLAEHIQKELRPAKVLDAGCGLGVLMAALWDCGMAVTGIDTSLFALEQVPEKVRSQVKRHSVADSTGERFDLTICLGVLPYLDPEEVGAALDSLCASSDVILFRANPDPMTPGLRAQKQVREWLTEFARRGFFADTVFDATLAGAEALLLRRGAADLDRVIDLSAALVEQQKRTAAAELRTKIVTERIETHLAAAEQGVLEFARPQKLMDYLDRAGVVKQLEGLTVEVQRVERMQEQRIDALRQDVLGVSTQVRDMQESRIWKTLKGLASVFGR